MTLRPFEPRDLAPVMEMVTGTFQQIFSEEMYLALHQAWPRGQIVDVQGDRLAGVLLSMRRSATVGRVLVMVVGEGFRGMGIGAGMLIAFLRECALEGMVSVVLEVRVSNTSARSFYRRFGFREVETLASYYPDGEDALLMSRELA